MELQENILKYLAKSSQPVDSEDLAKVLNEDHQKIVGGIKSLGNLGNLIQAEMKTVKLWLITSEGQRVVEKGSHEAVVYAAIPQDGKGISKQDLLKTVGGPEDVKIGMSKALQHGWIFIDKTDGGLLKRKVNSITDIVHKDLSTLLRAEDSSNIPEKSLSEYKKRKLVEEKTVKRYSYQVYLILKKMQHIKKHVFGLHQVI